MAFAKPRKKFLLGGMGVLLLVSAFVVSFVAFGTAQALASAKGFSQQGHAATAASPDSKTKVVKIIVNKKGVFAFSPKTLKIKVGTTVTWKNMTTVSHTSTSNTGVWDSGIIAPGGSFSFKFTSAGSFAYHCNIHPFMMGTIVVS